MLPKQFLEVTTKLTPGVKDKNTWSKSPWSNFSWSRSDQMEQDVSLLICDRHRGHPVKKISFKSILLTLSLIIQMQEGKFDG